jgi:hypothetical protein
VEGRAHRAARSPEMEETAVLCPEGAGDVVSEVPGNGEEADGVRQRTAWSKVWSARWFSSWNSADRWLEGSGRRRASGKALIRRFAVK